ncbi:hypothetical protein BWGOE4_25940 [Bacillus mycoides]|uniref:Uncharacterized protein n=1 Tax=Bacillus mycoides TaxID=1405 RepID=A0A1D3MM86_BACMY|nr:MULTISPECIES: hypothetical protein [Bacillus cereus group]MBJ8072080.1 hypothetical protein [Bacillus cereus]EJV72291.1 hypothetical protein IEM_00253 [Bacillus cereus BAG6O-2]MBJ8189799.1 hypothetical protein [Bacillus cereus]OFD42255.1 hypothetical protein BWGOE2_25250 [Bacillus mycoides]OFD46614.1 hypothetical protein BWGOE1_25830 [Bacillus mycoides]
MKKEKLLFWIYTTSMIIILSSIIYLAFAASSKKDTLTQFKKSPNIPLTIQDSNHLEDFTEYWTKEKMKNAIPVDIRELQNK